MARVLRPLPRRAHAKAAAADAAAGKVPARQRLPNEVLCEIIKYLPLNGSLYTLSNIAQLNKEWHAEASALLWMDIPVTAIVWCALVDYYTPEQGDFDREVDAACNFVNKHAEVREGVFRYRMLQIDKRLARGAYMARSPGDNHDTLHYRFAALGTRFHRFVKMYAKHVRRVEFNYPALHSMCGVVSMPHFPRGCLFNLASVSVVYGGLLAPFAQLYVQRVLETCIDRPLRSLEIYALGGPLDCRVCIDWPDLYALLERAAGYATNLETLKLFWDFSEMREGDERFLEDSLRAMVTLRTLHFLAGSEVESDIGGYLYEKGAVLTVIDGTYGDEEDDDFEEDLGHGKHPDLKRIKEY